MLKTVRARNLIPKKFLVYRFLQYLSALQVCGHLPIKLSALYTLYRNTHSCLAHQIYCPFFSLLILEAERCSASTQTNLLFIFFGLFAMSTIMPFLEHRRDAAFFVPAVPPHATMSHVPPARTKDDEADQAEDEDQNKQSDDEAKDATKWMPEHRRAMIC